MAVRALDIPHQQRPATDSAPVPRITATLTSFNRRPQTLECLRRLEIAAAHAGVLPAAVLVDDGSTDGTSEAVAQRFDWVRVVRGDGSLFWTRGMHRAMAQALTQADVDYILWLNDDTMLLPDALANLLVTARSQRLQTGLPTAVVGATTDASSGQLTYSGQLAASRWRRFNFRKVYSATDALACETMNGNVVLLPVDLIRRVGSLDTTFAHAGGDIDYGLRVGQAGFPLVVAPGVAGHCSNNATAGGFADLSAPLRQRWRHMLSRKGLPVATWLPLTRKHGGLLWPVYFAWPYLKVLGSSLVRKR